MYVCIQPNKFTGALNHSYKTICHDHAYSKVLTFEYD